MALGGRRPALVPPRWVPPVSTVICLLAVFDAGWLTYAHYTTPKVLYCTTGGFVNCGAVTTSIYSHFLGLPVSVLGLVWALGMLVLCSPMAWRASSIWVSRLRLAGLVAGLAMVFLLVYDELFKLHLLCEYCTGVHVLTVILFVVTAYGTALAVPRDLADEDMEDEPEEGAELAPGDGAVPGRGPSTPATSTSGRPASVGSRH